jgi:ATP/maltotriose-dependent transcriptional regulator MalT
MDALNYKLTILQASAGYGKSTALAALAEEIVFCPTFKGCR